MLSLKGNRDHSDVSLSRTALSSPWCGQGGAGGQGGGSPVGDQEVADANMRDPLSLDATLALPSCTIPFQQDHPWLFLLLLV